MFESFKVSTYPRGSKEKLSYNFSAFEFDCPCGCPVTHIADALPHFLEEMRAQLGAPLNITSGYRCEKHQAELRARGYETAKGISPHEGGIAADVTAVKESQHVCGQDLEYCARRGGFKAVGRGNFFVHVDLRSDRERAWVYGY